MAFVNGECIKIGQMSVFTASFGAKYVTLEEFDSIQSLTRNVVSASFYARNIDQRFSLRRDSTKLGWPDGACRWLLANKN